MSRGATRAIGDDLCCMECGRPLVSWSTDKLTGLLDRWGWDTRAAQVLDDPSAARNVLLLLDVDHFKQVNDTFGHLAGDAVLAAVAAAIRCAVRKNDVVGRYGGHGGDEFLLLLPNTDRSRSVAIAQRVQARLRTAAVTTVSTSGDAITITGLTASIGGTVGGAGGRSTLGNLVRRADAALLQAKRTGRDRVIVTSDGD